LWYLKNDYEIYKDAIFCKSFGLKINYADNAIPKPRKHQFESSAPKV